MNKIYTLFFIIVLVVLQGCGGGDSSGIIGKQSIDITVTCATLNPQDASSSDISTYQQVLPGDIIVKDENNTIIQMHTLVGADSRVCIQQGSAHIIR